MHIRKLAWSSVVMLPLAAGMAWLGVWQLDRMDEKRELEREFNSPEVLPLDAALETGRRFAPIRVTGRFDDEKHILLDNKVLRGRAGVHVFTPFQAFSGTTVLVNRGWKPLPADRSALPEIWTPSVPVALTGILAPPPEHRQRLGKDEEMDPGKWPQLVTYLDIDRAASALRMPLADRVVWLSPEHEAGFEGRDWSPAVTEPERHRAYAIQWFALSGTALVLWLVLITRSLSGTGPDRRPH